VLSQAQQDPVWNRQHVTNQLRSLRRDYFPAFLRPSRIVAQVVWRTWMRVQFWPSLKHRLTASECSKTCIRVQAIFRRTWLHQLPLVEHAMGRQALVLLMQRRC